MNGPSVPRFSAPTVVARSCSASEKSSSAWRAGVLSLVPSPSGVIIPSAYALCENDEPFADSSTSVLGASAIMMSPDGV